MPGMMNYYSQSWSKIKVCKKELAAGAGNESFLLDYKFIRC